MIKYPVISEKATNLARKDNVVTFVVEINATKSQIKNVVEKMYGVKVEKVNTLITPKGIKKAYVKLAKEYSAEDLLAKMGVV